MHLRCADVRETLHHALLTCGGLATELQAMRTGLEQAAGAQRLAQARDLPGAQNWQLSCGAPTWANRLLRLPPSLVTT